MSDEVEPGHSVNGNIITLAAAIKQRVDGEGLEIKTDYGVFYISKIEISFSDGYDDEICGYLLPDEAEGDTFDFFTAKSSDS